MIYEGSCDTKDCKNDAENSAVRHSNKLQTTTNIYFFTTSHFITLTIFDQTDYFDSLMSMRLFKMSKYS